MVCYRRWFRLTPEGFLLLSISCLTVLAFLINSTYAQDGVENIISRREGIRIRNKRDGSWSDWSVWSSCSRTCGGGIRTQTRQCQLRKTRSKSSETTTDTSKHARNVSNRHCEGHATRHHLCNTQECPVGTIDFRESQCKAFDNRPFMGKVYQWESFMDERSPCALTCRAKGYRFFATLNKSVIDGTTCTKPSQLDLHVCIAGTCMPIGCDGVAGSARRLDICGICGGDNSTCRLVSGIFTRPQLSLGYNVVAHIPKGACNINITEIKNSANHLALRKQDGSYIFNGDFRRPSWPGVYDGAGTKFQYSRNDLKAIPETISSAGPLKEAIDLVVLYQQPNPGIKYEYILPVGDAPLPPPMPLQDTPIPASNGRLVLAATSRPGSYISGPQQLLGARTSSFSSNLKSLGPLPLASSDSALGHHHHHHHGHHRRRSHHHGGGSSRRDSAVAAAAAAASERSLSENPGNKKFYWKIMGYTNCSELCGGGTQRSIIRCVRAPLANPVSDRRCTAEQEKPPAQTIRCNLKPCPAEWIVEDWGNCSSECGEGFKSRLVHCQQRISPTLTMRVSEGACMKQKPVIRTSCQLKSCHHWGTSEWSECSSKCGNGVRKRAVTCVDSTKGNEVGSQLEKESSHCDVEEKPAEIKACNMGPCDMASDWFASEWSSDCSQRCGAGIQTRHVVCSGIHKYQNSSAESRELESNTIEDDDNDPHGKKFDKRRRSTVGVGGSSSEELFCDESRRPDSERECFSDRACGEAVWFTGPWGDCSVYCGKGLRTRQVLCIIFSRGKFKVVTDSLCPANTKPEEREICEATKTCPSRWFTSEWSECSVVCGGGTQKRSVSCRASNWTLSSTLCSDKDRPVERRSCNEQKCSLSVSSPSSSKINSRNSNTDESGMVKDKPLEQQVADTSSTPTPTSYPIRSSTNSTFNNRTAILNDNFSKVGFPSVLLSTTSSTITSNQSHLHQEANEEPDDPDCKNEYRNCALVVQARLCRYKYYKTVCCDFCQRELK